MPVETRFCDLCRREVPQLTRHHLIPRARHRNQRTRRTFDRVELQGKVCMPCRKRSGPR